MSDAPRVPDADHQSQARQDAQLVAEFLRRQEEHWRQQAEKAYRRGSLRGAMQYHEYAEALAEGGLQSSAFNGNNAGGDDYPCVTLAECREALGQAQPEEGFDV